MTVGDFIAAGSFLVILVGVLAWGLNGKSKSDVNSAIVQENTSLRNQLGDSQKAEALASARADRAEKNEAYLKDLAQNRPDFGKLTVQLTKQHGEILTSFEKLTKGITTLASNIAKERKDG